jgi:hypothetical protein
MLPKLPVQPVNPVRDVWVSEFMGPLWQRQTIWTGEGPVRDRCGIGGTGEAGEGPVKRSDFVISPPQQNLWGDSGSGSRPKL